MIGKIKGKIRLFPQPRKEEKLRKKSNKINFKKFEMAFFKKIKMAQKIACRNNVFPISNAKQTPFFSPTNPTLLHSVYK